MKRWSSLIRFLGPAWLTRDRVTIGNAEQETNNRVLYTLGVFFTARVERVIRGVKARFPGAGGPEDALRYSGADLHIPRGPDESGASYATRLQRGVTDWRSAGTAWSMLEQVRGYCSPHAVMVRLVNQHGTVYTIDRAGARSIVKGTQWDWNGETLENACGLMWLIIYPTAQGEPWTRPPTVGAVDAGLVGGVSYTVGSTATAGDVKAIQRILQTFKPVGRFVSIVVCYDDSLFDPDVSMTCIGGDWGIAHQIPGYAPSRNANAVYWVGTSIGSGL